MSSSSDITLAASQSPFLMALAKKPTTRVPVWFMRQAGRSLPEYRALRPDGSILEAIKDPQLAAELTLQPVRRYGVDAAVLYSDIIVPSHAAGFGIDIIPGQGPVAEAPFSESRDLARLANFSAEQNCSYVADAIGILKGELQVPLIGFAGAPFTVASYLIEGRPTRSFTRTKQMMHEAPELFGALMARLAEMTVDFLKMQANAGVDALQLFDSWVGALSPREYRKYVFPHVKEIMEEIAQLGLPSIHFGVNTSDLLELIAATGTAAIGLDFRTEISAAQRRLGPGVAFQGNLDPTICLCSTDVILDEARQTLVDSAPAPGYVFNLGHGVLPQTDPEKLQALVEFVHAKGSAIRAAALESA